MSKAENNPNVSSPVQERLQQIRAEALLELITNLHGLTLSYGPLTDVSTTLLFDSVLKYEVMKLCSGELMAFCEALFTLPGAA